MIRAHFGLERTPFDGNHIQLLPHQQRVFDTLQVHARQGGFCLVMGEPGTGKSVIREAVQALDPKKTITPTINRTLHTYANIIHILCDAFKIEANDVMVSKREKKLIEAAFKINARGRMLVPIIDDAHLLDIDGLRRLRLLFEDFPKNHNLLLVAQPPLLQKLKLSVNEDIRSRITYSVTLPRLNPDDVKEFIFAQLDQIRLGHNTFTDDALELIVRSSDGILRKVRNLCVSGMLEAVRDQTKEVGLDQINRVLLQPHWRRHQDIEAT
ncbi:MAG: AAA family ATPase [bacterium]|nr:AAA family ATPase [bacterium]